jgi:uncharacterized RmlC-like cupin family protein
MVTSPDLPLVIHEDKPSTATTAPASAGGLTAIVAHESALMWFARARVEAGATSRPHHHGLSEMAIHVIRGTLRFHHGAGLRASIDVPAGAYAFVPPGLVHTESALDNEGVEAFVALAPTYASVPVDRAEPSHEPPGSPGITVVNEESQDTGQTFAMTRSAGIHRGSAATRLLWFGKATGIPNVTAGKHHHGAAETWGYIASGHVRVYFGEDFAEYVDARAGDYIFVPAWIPHLEVTMEKQAAILARSPDNIVVNLE